MILYIMYQSIPSLTIPLDKTPGNFFERVNAPPKDTNKVQKADPLGQKNHAKTPPRAIIFKNRAKHTRHETEIMKNSVEMAC